MDLNLNKLAFGIIIFFAMSTSWATECSISLASMYERLSLPHISLLQMMYRLEETSPKELKFTILRQEPNSPIHRGSTHFDYSIVFHENENSIIVFILVEKEKKQYAKTFLFPTENFYDEWAFQIEKYIFDVIEQTGGIHKENHAEKKTKQIKHEKISTKINTFPSFALGIIGVSYKSYNDSRENLFSLFPLNFEMSFFPFGHLELGIFTSFSHDSSTFLYYDFNVGHIREKSQYINLEYGTSLGYLSTFQNSIFSLGLSFYNKQLFLNPDDILKYSPSGIDIFLPQFAIYQKIYIRLTKILYYTIMIQVKTTQKMWRENNQLFGRALDYDLPELQLSIIGVSLIF